MKVSSAAPQISALETWLHETQEVVAYPDSAAAPASTLAAISPVAPQGHDVAEGLLELNVWSAHATSTARQLTTAATAPPPSGAPALWSNYIFAPLTITRS